MRLARVSDGESFGLLTSNPRIDSPVQLDLKLVEAEQVTSPILALDSYRYLDGIRFDEHGNAISYDVLREHPGDDAFSLTENFDTIDASSILHYFRSDRSGQIRGIPDITPALPLFAQLRRFTLAVLAAAETAADFAGILYTDAPAGGEADAAEPFEPIELEKRALLTMPGGWKMAQMHAEQPATTYAEFKREILNEIARCLNMPFKKGIREAVFLLTTLSTRWVAISGRRSSPSFAGRPAAPSTNVVANPFVNLANHRVGQPIEGSRIPAPLTRTRPSAHVRPLLA
jgi:capsid protein